jgi:hypothetical protein
LLLTDPDPPLAEMMRNFIGNSYTVREALQVLDLSSVEILWQHNAYALVVDRHSGEVELEQDVIGDGAEVYHTLASLE